MDGIRKQLFIDYMYYIHAVHMGGHHLRRGYVKRQRKQVPPLFLPGPIAERSQGVRQGGRENRDFGNGKIRKDYLTGAFFKHEGMGKELRHSFRKDAPARLQAFLCKNVFKEKP